MLVFLHYRVQAPNDVSLISEIKVVFFSMPGIHQGLDRHVCHVFCQREVGADAGNVYRIPPGDMLKFWLCIIGPAPGGAIDQLSGVTSARLLFALIVRIGGAFYGVDDMAPTAITAA